MRAVTIFVGFVVGLSAFTGGYQAATASEPNLETQCRNMGKFYQAAAEQRSMGVEKATLVERLDRKYDGQRLVTMVQSVNHIYQMDYGRVSNAKSREALRIAIFRKCMAENTTNS